MLFVTVPDTDDQLLGSYCVPLKSTLQVGTVHEDGP